MKSQRLIVKNVSQQLKISRKRENTMKKIRLIIFAKAPIAGFAKTRLIPALGEDGAAQLAKKLLLNTVRNGVEAKFTITELCVTPEPSDSIWKPLAIADDIVWSAQGDGDLGDRLARASKRAIDKGEAVLLIGTDCPQLTPSILQDAATALIDANAVIIPAADGGYTMLGLNEFHPSLFEHIAWSTESVFVDTVHRLKKLHWRITVLQHLHDIDEPKDLRWLPNDWPEYNIY